MSTDKLKRMALSGIIRGSAALREQDGRTHVSLSLMGAAGELMLAAYGNGGVTLSSPSGGTAELPQTGVCAMALFSGGSMVSRGFTGECREPRTRILGEIRIRAAEEYARLKTPSVTARQSPDPPAHAPAPAGTIRANSPSSAAAAAILEQARRLFGALDGMTKANGEGGRAQEQGEEELERIENPFPRTFPGSAWKKRPGQERLYGEVRVNGRLMHAEALPADLKDRRSRSAGTRVLISKDGRRYRIEMMREGAKHQNIF